MRQLLGEQILYIYYNTKQKQSVVVCEKQRFHFSISCLTLIKRLCILYGTNYKWQKDFSKEVLKIKQKVPIVLKERRQFILFPIMNIRSKTCLWLNYNAIEKVVDFHYQFSLLYFNRNDIFCVRVNSRVIKKQIKRCKLILTILDSQ